MTFPRSVMTSDVREPVGLNATLSVQGVLLLVFVYGLLVAYLCMVAALTLGAGQDLWRVALLGLPGHGLEILLAGWLMERVVLDEDILLRPSLLTLALLFGVLLPVMVGTLLEAGLRVALGGGSFVVPWWRHLLGHAMGAVAIFPLMWVVLLQGWRRLYEAMRSWPAIVLLVCSVAWAWFAAVSLSAPLVAMALGLLAVAACTDFAVTAASVALTSAVGAGLLGAAGLVPPATGLWWRDALFVIGCVAYPLPALYLSTLMDGGRAFLRRWQASERRFDAFYGNVPAMLQSMDRQGRLLRVSGLWLQTLGYQTHEVLGRLSTDFLTPDSAIRAREVIIPRSLRDGRCDDVELQAVTRDGRILDLRVSVVWSYDEEGAAAHTMEVLQDVTESKQLVARSHFAEHDPLTGLPNRVLLKDRLDRICAHHVRHGGKFAVGFLDLDHFKAINDTHGHDAGDVLLQAVSRRLQLALRASDTVCRLAGDEFVLLFTSLERHEDLGALAEKVLARVAQPCVLGSSPDAPRVEVACSLGVAVFPQHGNDAQTLLHHADQAMYSAKSKGRNRCEFFGP